MILIAPEGSQEIDYLIQAGGGENNFLFWTEFGHVAEVKFNLGSYIDCEEEPQEYNIVMSSGDIPPKDYPDAEITETFKSFSPAFQKLFMEGKLDLRMVIYILQILSN